MKAKISAAWMIITSEFFSFNVWEWFLHSSVLERTEFDLSKINWLRGVILLNPIVLVSWGRFPLCHTPIRPISAFRDQISILIVGCVTTWSRGSHQEGVMRISPTLSLIMPKTHWRCQVGQLQELGQRSLKRHWMGLFIIHRARWT